MKAEEIDRSALEDALGHRFQNRAILDQALTHSSFAREAESHVASGTAGAAVGDNEQMEFLGDAVLSFVVSQELFQRFPEYTEGDLSKLRAHIVSARALVRPARTLEIGKYLRFGRGEEKSGGRTKSALLVNALEALIAALFLDAGFEKAHKFVVSAILQPALEELQKRRRQRAAGHRLQVGVAGNCSCLRPSSAPLFAGKGAGARASQSLHHGSTRSCSYWAAERLLSAAPKPAPRSEPSRGLHDRPGSIYNHCREVLRWTLQIRRQSRLRSHERSARRARSRNRAATAAGGCLPRETL